MKYESLADIRRRRHEGKFGRGVLTFVVGMQFGSEAKGSIVQHLAPGVSNAVRTGAVNAGHTVYVASEKFVNRQLPSAWQNRQTNLILGAGTLISPHVLLEEIERCEAAGYLVKNRLYIDGNAHIITEKHIEEEAEGNLGERIGSTSARGREGIAVAMAHKVLRMEDCVQVKDYEPLKQYATDTVTMVNEELEGGADVLVEGTQGYGLSIDHGYFPYVTSRNATVSAFADSVGVQPEYFQTNVIGVVRSYPIRVAGNSGPFAEDSEELTWEEMRERVGNPELPIENTTVTGLPRRIATFSDQQFIDACRVNRPTEIALTFADYIDPDVFNKDYISDEVLAFTDRLEDLSDGVPVTLLNNGPNSTFDFDSVRASYLRKMSD